MPDEPARSPQLTNLLPVPNERLDKEHDVNAVSDDDPHKVEKLTNAGRDEDMSADSA